MLKRELLKYEILEFLKSGEKTENEILINFSKYFEICLIRETLKILLEKKEINFENKKYFVVLP